MKKTKLAIALAVFAFTTHAVAQSPVKSSVPPASLASYELKIKLKTMYPDTDIVSVAPSPMSGVFEIVMGKNIAYTDSNGEKFLTGRMFDMQTQTDLTEPRLAQLNKIDLSMLDKNSAIKTVKGNGKATLYVFSDPDCPYCKRLEQTLRDLDNVTIYTFLYPIDQLHPEARQVSESIWCAKDKRKAWDDYMLRESKPAEKKCANPVEMNVRVAQKLGINGTPTLINGSGIMKAGALPLPQLMDFVK